MTLEQAELHIRALVVRLAAMEEEINVLTAGLATNAAGLDQLDAKVQWHPFYHERYNSFHDSEWQARMAYHKFHPDGEPFNPYGVWYDPRTPKDELPEREYLPDKDVRVGNEGEDAWI
jgi:hypothetical protein|tara:strand:+ start:3024 stop:3377 length:354 start_codon:yes stop_codon:yes gene_type:complete